MLTNNEKFNCVDEKPKGKVLFLKDEESEEENEVEDDDDVPFLEPHILKSNTSTFFAEVEKELRNLGLKVMNLHDFYF